jgi:hypothetical protein
MTGCAAGASSNFKWAARAVFASPTGKVSSKKLLGARAGASVLFPRHRRASVLAIQALGPACGRAEHGQGRQRVLGWPTLTVGHDGSKEG